MVLFIVAERVESRLKMTPAILPKFVESLRGPIWIAPRMKDAPCWVHQQRTRTVLNFALPSVTPLYTPRGQFMIGTFSECLYILSEAYVKKIQLGWRAIQTGMRYSEASIFKFMIIYNSIDLYYTCESPSRIHNFHVFCFLEDDGSSPPLQVKTA